MSLTHILYVAGGAVAAGVVGSLGKDGLAHRGAVKVAYACLRVADKVASVTQTIVDEAADINAEARRQARIDAAVAERLAELEADIRAEVIAQVDGTGADE
jgi:hypothetical protein